MTMLRACLLLTLAVAAMADDGYARQDASYGAPTGGYAAATGGYQEPQSGYGDYQEPQQGYGVTASDDGGLDFGAKISELLPLFIAVFAAIILAQLLGPLFLGLLGLLVGILPMALNIKAPIINMILAPFALQLCNIGPPLAAFPAAGGRSLVGRDLKDAASGFGFDISEDKMDIIADLASQAIASFTSQYEV